MKNLKDGGKSFFHDFKEFINRGNVIDMAVGVVVGGAFGKITSSLVNDIVMPLISLMLGKINFTELAITLRGEELDAAGEVLNPALTLNYGMFIQYIIDFLLIALAVFVAIRLLMNLRAKKQAEETAAPVEEAPAEPEPTKEELLLSEIRDLLKAQSSPSERHSDDTETS